MRKMLAMVGLTCLALGASTAAAQVFNGDFSAGIGGWTPSGNGPSVSWHPTFGNPAGSAYFYHNGGGDAALTQGFLCGSGHGGGNCNITLDYRQYVMGGAQIQIIIEIDGIATYTMNHATEDAEWHTVALTVPCGDHLLSFKVNTLALPFLAGWSVFLDNVAGECVAVVRDQESDWGTLKALYR